MAPEYAKGFSPHFRVFLLLAYYSEQMRQNISELFS